MAADAGAALVGGKLLGGHRSYSGNPQEWSAYVGVIAPPILTAMDPAEAMTAPIMVDGLSEEDHRIDKLDAELRTFEGLVRTCRATFGEGISDSITQTVIKSQNACGDQASSGAANFRGNRRAHTSHVCRACIAGKGRKAPHFRQSGGEEAAAATPVVSLDCFLGFD